MWDKLRHLPGKAVRSERLLVSAVALVATYAFFYEYLPPFQRVHLYSDIEGYHYPLQRYAFQALALLLVVRADSRLRRFMASVSPAS